MLNRKNQPLDVSVIICTHNAEKTIKNCLISIRKNNPREIILVDAHSSDQTQKIAKPYVDKIVEDLGKGLATARNIGLKHITGKYVFNLGSDNVVPKFTLKYCLDYLKKNNYIGVSTQTFIKNTHQSYFSYAMNLYKKTRFYPGRRAVIGTPHLFLTSILKKYKFDNRMTWSDDSDLCLRLAKQKYTFGVANTYVYEIGKSDIKSILDRWKHYGLSDYEYYSKYHKGWKIKRKILSALHPLFCELIKPLTSDRLKIINKIYMTPFLIIIIITRYYGWLLAIIKPQSK